MLSALRSVQCQTSQTGQPSAEGIRPILTQGRAEPEQEGRSGLLSRRSLSFCRHPHRHPHPHRKLWHFCARDSLQKRCAVPEPVFLNTDFPEIASFQMKPPHPDFFCVCAVPGIHFSDRPIFTPHFKNYIRCIIQERNLILNRFF